MAQITVTATCIIERTKTVDIAVRISDVKEWMRENYGSPKDHGMDWNDPSILGEYFQANEHLVEDAEGNIDDISETWEIQNAEEIL